MKFKYLKFFSLLLMMAMLSGGCGMFAKRNQPVQRVVPGAERSFAAALQYLRTGNEADAREQLESIVDESPIAGITDEALFRLALLSLRDEGGRGEARAKRLLERLMTDYSDSIWSRQAAPLSGYLQETSGLRARARELKNLRNQNLSLSRDNKELRQSLERIKNLDLELEQKIRR